MPFTRAERDELLSRAWSLDARIYPPDAAQAPHGRPAALLREAYYQALGEYADRLPRVVMSACPFTGRPLKRAFDPWGLDGPWWQQGREVEIDEPAPPPAFKVLLGALALRGRAPAEARETVIPGPEVPFVVPRLMDLPGMIAVVARLDLETGDTAYPIAYFSEEEISQTHLHQFWLQQEHWFDLEGKSAWLIANDPWDFELGPWVRSGRLRWIEPGDPASRVVDGSAGARCPFLDLPGERQPQSIAGGQRELLELPDGTPVDPWED